MFSVCLPLPRSGQHQTQWDFVLSNFPPDALYVIGSSDDAPSTNVFSRLNATYITTADELPSRTSLVVLAADNGKYIQGDVSLVDFTHPTDVIYLFGDDKGFLSVDEMGSRAADSAVYVPTASTDDMWSWVTYGVVMWDRLAKNG